MSRFCDLRSRGGHGCTSDEFKARHGSTLYYHEATAHQEFTIYPAPQEDRLQKITLHSFRRITSNTAYIPEIDGLRFIAILAVISLHCYAAWVTPEDMSRQQGALRLLWHGGYGVQLFFAISGFILALPFARHFLSDGRKVQLPSYFLRRLTRLEPPYVLWLLIRSALLLATAFLPVHAVLVHLLASIFYVHNIAFGIASRIEAVSWTLEIEVQFYCLVPLITLVYRIPKATVRRASLLLLIAGATPLQRAFIPAWEGPQNFGAFQLSILAYIQFFLVGLLVADLYVDGWQRIPCSWKWDALSIPLWILFFWLEPHAFLFIGPIILPVVIVGGFKGRLVRKFLRHPVISTIGGMCYSIYLTHRTTITLMQRLFAPLHLDLSTELVISFTLIAPLSIALASLYFLLIERPCMDPRWPAKLMARLRSGRTQPPLADPAS